MMPASELRNARSMCEVFQRTVLGRADVVALRTPDAVGITWREYGARVRRIAVGLHALGVRRGDTVALMMTNRPEFHLVDVAVIHLGAVPFSVYNTSSAEQVAHLFANAGNRVVVCERQFLALVREVEHVVDVDELDRLPEGELDFEAAWRAVEPDDVLTLIYTSGTTGPPKGVELTHRNVAFSMGAVLESPDIAAAGRDGRVLSFLPDAHMANRYFAHYLPIATGSTTTCVADARTLIDVLPRVRPTVILGVPMLWYKLKAGVERAIAAEPGVRGALARWAVRIGLEKVQGRSRPVRYALARLLVLRKLPAKIGLDACLAPISGAAPIAVEALEFLMAVGIPVREGWAMSETAVHGTLNPSGAIRPGTVGVPMFGCEVRLADDGELLLRSPAVMRGYRKDPAGTAEAVDADGWLHTGDIATMSDGYVSIVDRKKELIINAAGKNMSPSNIENAVRTASPLIGSVVAIGDRRPFVVALITLDPDVVPGDPAVTSGDPDVRAKIEAAVARANLRLSRVEQIKRFTILPVHWHPGGTELTPTLKLRRRPIEEAYAREIEALFVHSPPAR